MAAARYVGRVGGLAVALGVGAALLAGQGVACADSATSDSVSSESTSPEAASADTASSGAAVAAGPQKPARPRLPRLFDIDLRQPAAAGVADETPTSEPQRVRTSLSAAVNALTGVTKPSSAVSANTVVVRKPERTLADPTDHQPPRPRAVTSRVERVLDNIDTDSGRDADQDVSEESGLRTSAQTSALAQQQSSTVVGDASISAAGTTPKAPVDSPASWVLLAAARREFTTDRITYNPSIGVTDGVITGTNNGQVASSRNPLTYTLVSDPSGGGKVTIDKTTGSFTYLPYSAGTNPDGSQQFAATEQFKVLVAETTPFVAAMEKIPVLGDLVQPIVVRIHQVPILSHVLAPVIGYAAIIPVTVNDAQLAAGNVDPIAFTTTVVSFDGTPISVNYFPALGLANGAQAPTILNGPSLATAGYTDPTQETTVFGLVPGLKPLRAAGYNVVTWDPRGEFASGGVLQLDSPDYEAKDVSAIITWVEGQPGTRFEGTTADPLIGMVGGSYGGGIQLTSAGIDKRIDAIVPGIAWNSLDTALYPNSAFKTSFASLLLLSLVVADSRINPEIYSGILTGAAFGFLTPGQQAFLAAASPKNVVGNITVPTLLIQGTVDDLFTLQQAVDNAEQIQAANPGVPVKMIWYCGGHGQCLDPVDQTKQTAVLTQQTLAWMDLYVKYKGTQPPAPIDIPNFQWVDQKGTLYSSTYLPTEASPLYAGSIPITVSRGGGVLPIVPVLGGSGPQNQATFPVSLALGSKAINAINVKVPKPASPNPEAADYIVGSPTVTLTYSGVGTSRAVYAQLVDDKTGRVVGNVVTPIPVTLDGKTRTVTVAMENIAYTMETGDSLTLQIVGSATPYENFTSYGAIDVSRVDLTLPTANPANVHFEESLSSDQPGVGAGGLLGI